MYESNNDQQAQQHPNNCNCGCNVHFPIHFSMGSL